MASIQKRCRRGAEGGRAREWRLARLAAGDLAGDARRSPWRCWSTPSTRRALLRRGDRRRDPDPAAAAPPLTSERTDHSIWKATSGDGDPLGHRRRGPPGAGRRRSRWNDARCWEASPCACTPPRFRHRWTASTRHRLRRSQGRRPAGGRPPRRARTIDRRLSSTRSTGTRRACCSWTPSTAARSTCSSAVPDVPRDPVRQAGSVPGSRRFHSRELVLTKLQIVELNEKDVRDTTLLFYGHEVSDHDDESINGEPSPSCAPATGGCGARSRTTSNAAASTWATMHCRRTMRDASPIGSESCSPGSRPAPRAEAGSFARRWESASAGTSCPMRWHSQGVWREASGGMRMIQA